MRCKKVKENLWLFVLGDLDARPTRDIQDHILDCISCERDMNDLRRQYLLLPKREPLSEAAVDRYVQKTMAKLNTSESKNPILTFRWAPAMAVLLMMIFGGLSYRQHERHKIEEVIANLEILENLDAVEQDMERIPHSPDGNV